MKAISRRSSALFLALIATLTLSACTRGEELARRRGDVVQRGARGNPLAYAWYARGFHHEAAGDLTRAERDYRAAVSEDPKSGAAWAALGRVACQNESPETDRIFAQGLRKAERLAPLYYERGRCMSHRRMPANKMTAHSCDDFLSALKLEPETRRFSEQYATCLRDAGRATTARRVTRASRLFLGAQLQNARAPRLEDVDKALMHEDLEAAQNAALDLMGPGVLSVRALLLGKTALANDQAELVLAASPNDPDALITQLALSGHLQPGASSFEGLSDVGLLLLVQVLQSRTNQQIARAFLQSYADDLSRSEDPLVIEWVDEHSDLLR